MSLLDIRHPQYLRDSKSWQLWRDTFEGGEYYRDKYLQKFTDRETEEEFLLRRHLTPIPTFAKAAILDVRNSIYQRLVGVSRVGGSSRYQDAVRGVGGGVDGQGSTMDAFMGKDVLTELLLMGKVGVYVDAAPPTGPTLADVTYPPYLTYYRVEDILSYSYAPRGKGGEFQAVLLRDWNVTVSSSVSGITLPSGTQNQYRLIWKDDEGVVWYRLYDVDGQMKNRDGMNEDGAVRTNLKRIPFVLLDIDESLMKDVSSYQISLLNLTSSDVYYAIRSNAPFLRIQRDGYSTGDHLKPPEGASNVKEPVEQIGAGKGRYYGINEEAPSFTAPPTDPLEASMKLQAKLEDSIRNLINLAVANKAGSRTESAEAKKIGQGGLEAGLSFIGLEMEEAEKKVSQMWAEYESVNNPQSATIHYPDRYVLKSDEERINEAHERLKLVEKLPGQQVKRDVSKQIINGLLGGIIPQDELEGLMREIDDIDYILSDPNTIMQAHKSGLVGDETASEALGFDPDEVEKAREDRAQRIALTLAAQTPQDNGASEEGGGAAPGNPGARGRNSGVGATNPASRGAPELDTNPNSGSDEKQDDEDDSESDE